MNSFVSFTVLMKKKIGYICICISCLLFASCTDEYTICDQPRSVNFGGAFYKNTSGIDVETPVSSLSIRPANTSAYIYDRQPGLSRFSFALDPGKDSAKYIISTSIAAPEDTVTLYYTSKTVNLSPQCGNITEHSLNNARTTVHSLKSVTITKASVDNISAVNLKVYF